MNEKLTSIVPLLLDQSFAVRMFTTSELSLLKSIVSMSPSILASLDTRQEVPPMCFDDLIYDGYQTRLELKFLKDVFTSTLAA